MASKVNRKMGKGLRLRLFAWWYFTIGAGFVLLGIRAAMVGDRLWLVLLRFAIGVGFAALGFGTWKARDSSR